jgi:hypothetical protein
MLATLIGILAACGHERPSVVQTADPHYVGHLDHRQASVAGARHPVRLADQCEHFEHQVVPKAHLVPSQSDSDDVHDVVSSYQGPGRSPWSGFPGYHRVRACTFEASSPNDLLDLEVVDVHGSYIAQALVDGEGRWTDNPGLFVSDD